MHMSCMNAFVHDLHHYQISYSFLLGVMTQTQNFRVGKVFGLGCES